MSRHEVTRTFQENCVHDPVGAFFLPPSRGVVEHLIIKDPQQVTQLGGLYGTPLHASELGGHFEISQLLTAHGAEVNLRCADNWTPLHIASYAGNLEIGRWLLDNGADVNSQEKYGRTPLHLATSCGHLQACRVLLERHINPFSLGIGAWTP